MEGTIAISNGVGPLLGGVLSEKASWRVSSSLADLLEQGYLKTKLP